MKVACLLLFTSVLLYVTLINGQTGPVIHMTTAQKQIVLNAHNDLRRAVNAQSMPPLVWAEGLNLWATDAVAKKCAWEETVQSVRTNVAGYSYVGENIAAGSIPDVAFLLTGWASEKSYYTYEPMNRQNWQHIGHYTQQVWANTYAIACVVINCTQSNPAVNFMLACNYGPGGNYLNQYPYKECASGTCNFITPSPGGATLVGQSATPSRSTAASPTRTRSPTPSPSRKCTPKTCSSNSCGTFSNGCGGSINCGNCASNGKCVNNVCVACSPTQTCSNKRCGTINDGCGNTVSCGSCSTGYICENYACTANPVCKSCASAGANCGTITISGCPVQSCGTCASGYQCKSGKCTATPCSNCPINSACVSGSCQCLDGFEDEQDGNGCTPVGVIPRQFTEFYASSGSLNTHWAFKPAPGNLTGQPTYTIPELDVVSNVQTRLYWLYSDRYTSLELTTLTAEVFFTSKSSVVGLGLRLNQGTRRTNDSIQWNLDSSGAVTLNLLWYGTVINQGSYGKATLKSNAWNTFTIQIFNANSSGTLYATSNVLINNVAVVRSQPVRPYDAVGGAYLYSSGISGWRNITVSTKTSLHTAIKNCMPYSDWATFVSGVLKVSPGVVKLVNYQIDGECVGQGTNKKRQTATDGLANSFVFSIESTETLSSKSLASQFIQLAESWDESLAATGGVVSVGYADLSALGMTDPIDLTNAVDLTTTENGVAPVPATTGNGLSAGAIAGIVVGSVIGALIVALIALGVVGGIVFGIVKRGKRSELDISTRPVESGRNTVESSPVVWKQEEVEVIPMVENKRRSVVMVEEGNGGRGSEEVTEEMKEEEESEDEKKPRGAVDLYELNPRHHASISGRVPEGFAGSSSYLPGLGREVEEEVEEKEQV